MSHLTYVDQMEIILPEELYNLIWAGVEKRADQIQYSRVIMPLSALLQGEFFNEYIKKGISWAVPIDA